VKINRIIISSKVGHYLDGDREAYDVGHQCHPLVESSLVQTVSRHLEDSLLSVSIDKVVNLNVDPRPPKLTLLPTDLVVRFVFPLRPVGQSAAWNTAEIVTNVKELSTLKDQVTRWGTSSAAVFSETALKHAPIDCPLLQLRPFYLDGPGALIFGERLENLAYRLATVLGQSLVSHSGLYRVVSQAPQGRRY
jgi:hypothetical protein